MKEYYREKQLIELEKLNKAIISEVPDHPLLPPLGVRKGKEVILKSRQAWHGPIIIEIEDRQVAIDPEIAAQIKIKEEVSIDAAV